MMGITSKPCVAPVPHAIPYYFTDSKAHIPPEMGFALGTNANEIYTKKMKYTWPTPAFCVGTQRQLYSTDWRRGLASGVTQILGLASGIGVGGNAKIYQHVGIFCVG